jgi:hypothetical protein
MRVKKYGPASERLSDHQLELLEQETGVGHTSGDISSRHWKLIQKVPPANSAGFFWTLNEIYHFVRAVDGKGFGTGSFVPFTINA